jgi:hypothetical protein
LRRHSESGAFGYFLSSFSGSTSFKIADMRLPPWLWRICRSKGTKRFLIASPFLLMIAIAVFYGVANWYGTWAIEREAVAVKAAGWPVIFEEAIGRLPAAEDDLFQHPAVLREMELPEEQRLRAWKSKAFAAKNGLSGKRDWISNLDLVKLSDIKKLVDPPRPGDTEERIAKDLMMQFQPQSQRLAEIATAFERPATGWWDGRSRNSTFKWMPEIASSYSVLSGWIDFAADHSRISLAAHEADAAAADVRVLFRIRDRFEAGPGLVCFLMANITDTVLRQVVWEGIKRGVWTEPLLADFQTRIRPAVVQDCLHRSLRSEPAYMIALARNGDLEEIGVDWDEVVTQIKQGIKDRDLATIRKSVAWLWETGRPAGLMKLEIRDEMRRLRKAVEEAELSPHRPVSESPALFPDSTYEKGRNKMHECIVTRILLSTGIALERYRLKYGAVPEKLEALVPEFLREVPRDIYDGQPLRYQVLPDGMPNRNRTKNTAWTTGQIPGLTEEVYKAK